MLRAYLQVFRIRGLSVPLLTSFAGSLPIGMLNLSVLLLVRLHGQSFGAAGIVAGALNLGSGAGLVAEGAWIDRRGRRDRRRRQRSPGVHGRGGRRRRRNDLGRIAQTGASGPAGRA
jgi:MFS family permease